MPFYIENKINPQTETNPSLARLSLDTSLGHWRPLVQFLFLFFCFLPVKEARGEKLHTPLNIDQALDARDAVAKALYRSDCGSIT